LRETALILQEGLTISEKPIREHLDAIGHKDAFEYIVSLADAKERLSEKVIKDVHSLVLMNDAINKGVYRRVPVKIPGSGHVPPPYLVREQLQELLEEYELTKPKLHIVEAAALFHLRFESIHPFIDGNGRTGRLIMNLELIKAGFLPINVKFAERTRYYDCFDSYYANNSYDALADLIAGYEIDELENRISILEAANNF
jgi:Fic family protein